MDEEQSLLPKARPRRKLVYFAAIVANLVAFVGGISFSWTSPILPKLTNNWNLAENPLGTPITVTETSWITGFINLGSFISPIIAGKLTNKLGRKKTLLIMTIPMVISLLTAAFATTIYLFYLSRLLMGLGRSGALIALPIYLAEISENHNRGKITSLIGIFISLGELFPYIFGPYMTIRNFCLACLLPLLIFFPVFLLWMPETPHYYALVGNQVGARSSLIKLKNKDTKELDEEMKLINNSLQEKNQNRGTFKDLFASTASKKAFKITLILIILQSLSGGIAISAYLQTIFIAAGGTSASPEVSSIIVGVVQMLTTLLMSFLVDRWGRRFLMVISSIGTFLSLTALGIYFLLKSNGIQVDFIFWLPVLSLLLYILFLNLGIMPVPYILLMEMFPPHLKAPASVICSYSRTVFNFLINVLFPQMGLYLGLAGTFWIFAFACLIMGIISFRSLPETKGKSLQEIQRMLAED